MKLLRDQWDWYRTRHGPEPPERWVILALSHINIYTNFDRKFWHPSKSVQERALRPKPTTFLLWAFLRAAAPVLKSPQFKFKFGKEKEQIDRCFGRVPRAPVGSDVMSMRRAWKEGAGVLAQVEWCNPSPTRGLQAARIRERLIRAWALSPACLYTVGGR